MSLMLEGGVCRGIAEVEANPHDHGDDGCCGPPVFLAQGPQQPTVTPPPPPAEEPGTSANHLAANTGARPTDLTLHGTMGERAVMKEALRTWCVWWCEFGTDWPRAVLVVMYGGMSLLSHTAHARGGATPALLHSRSSCDAGPQLSLSRVVPWQVQLAPLGRRRHKIRSPARLSTSTELSRA